MVAVGDGGGKVGMIRGRRIGDGGENRGSGAKEEGRDPHWAVGHADVPMMNQAFFVFERLGFRVYRFAEHCMSPAWFVWLAFSGRMWLALWEWVCEEGGGGRKGLLLCFRVFKNDTMGWAMALGLTLRR
jgi:hypothetical protein